MYINFIKQNHHRFHLFFVLIIATAISFGFLYLSLGSLAQTPPPTGGIGLISQRTWDEPECVAWNSWDGNNFNGVFNPIAYYSDGATHSLCGPNDGWKGYGRAYIDGLYGAELVVNNPNCLNSGNCLRYRMWEGQNGPTGGLAQLDFYGGYVAITEQVLLINQDRALEETLDLLSQSLKETEDQLVREHMVNNAPFVNAVGGTNGRIVAVLKSSLIDLELLADNAEDNKAQAGQFALAA